MKGLPAGFGVLVTRPARQADTLCRLIEEAGGQPIRLPLLEVEPIAPSGEATARLACASRDDWLIFVSANAVRFAFQLAGPRWLEGACAKIAAVGEATERALADRGVAVDLRPEAKFNSESILAHPDWVDVAGQRFLIVRGEGGRELMAETLRERGAAVEYAEVYRRVPSRIDSAALAARWRNGEIAVVTLTSGEALDHLFGLMRDRARELLLQTPMVVIGDRVRNRALELGFREVIATEARDADLFDGVARLARELIKHTNHGD